MMETEQGGSGSFRRKCANGQRVFGNDLAGTSGLGSDCSQLCGQVFHCLIQFRHARGCSNHCGSRRDRSDSAGTDHEAVRGADVFTD